MNKQEYIPIAPGHRIPNIKADFSIIVNGYLFEEWEDGTVTIDGRRAPSGYSRAEIFQSIKNSPIKSREEVR